MGKILIHGNRWKKEKGLTLVETIVALSVFLIVSLSTVSIAVYSANSFKLVDIKYFFTKEIDTISNLYLSYSESDFSLAFKQYTSQDIEGYTDTTYYLNNKYEYVSSSSYAYRLTLTFTINEQSLHVLNIKSYKSSGSGIYERTVSK